MYQFPKIFLGTVYSTSRPLRLDEPIIQKNATSRKTKVSASLTPLAPRPLGCHTSLPGPNTSAQKRRGAGCDVHTPRIKIRLPGWGRKQGCFADSLSSPAHRLPTRAGPPIDGWMNEWMKRAPRPGITSFIRPSSTGHGGRPQSFTRCAICDTLLHNAALF